MRPVYDGAAFGGLYTYDDNDLGVGYSPEVTKFRLWAPAAVNVELCLYPSGVPVEGEEPRVVPMLRDRKGTWVAGVAEDLKGRFYTYRVRNDDVTREAVDPYARFIGAGGVRAQIADMSETNPEGWGLDRRVKLESPVDAVLYEIHVRDATIHDNSGVRHKGLFLGLAESGALTPDGLAAGIDHIAELGVTHVHLLPVYGYAFDNDMEPPYNWGYNPRNYNALHDAYSSNPYDGAAAVSEFKRMVKAFHDKGIGVVVDVVFNHTYKTDVFDDVIPGYFYREKPDHTYSNGSGCGNELATERAMVRKFVLDSVLYWAREFHLDGFRFDIMGLIDTETMNLIRAELDKIDPAIITYGEGWLGGETILPAPLRSVKDNTHSLNPKIAMFSDDMRDGMRGPAWNNPREPGFLNGAGERRLEDVRFGIAASVRHRDVKIDKVTASKWFWAQEPTQTVNFDSCHDNLTLWDKLIKTRPNASTKELTAMNRLAAFLVLTSQGIPFLHAGEEFARTKQGDENSYNAGDKVNRMDWNRKKEFLPLFAYYKGLVELRRAFPLFRIRTADEIRENLTFLETPSKEIIVYKLSQKGEIKAVVGINASESSFTLGLPSVGWNVVADGERAGTVPLYRAEETLEMKPKSAYVLLKNNLRGVKPLENTSLVRISGVVGEKLGAFPKMNDKMKIGLAAAAGAAALGIAAFLLRKRK